MLDFIPDDYNETAYIKETPGIHNAVRFTFRPMLSEERTVIFRKVDSISPEKIDALYVSAMARRIHEWSIKDAAGNPLPVTAENLRRLKPALFFRLWMIVAGMEPPDVDPEAKPAETLAQVDTELQAALEGKPVGMVAEEADRKN